MTQILTRRVPVKASLMLEQQGIPPLLARLFAARGVTDIDGLDTQLASLLPPERLFRADEAARLLADAIAAGRRLLIVADYDCDGATACAVGLRALRSFNADVRYLVPNRFEYGYGLTPEIVRLAAAQKPDLLITVDNGIASFEGVAEARRLGMTTLITDHHLPAAMPANELPEAEVIVNPNQPGCDFPSKALAGVGVMFYVMLALRGELRRRGRFNGSFEPNLAALLDLVALGTVADVVPLDRNNRILVAQGIARMRAGRMQPGIAALFRAAGRDAERASSFDLGFALGPRLNAAGRLSDMSIGIECLLADDAERALDLARQLDALNRERRALEADMQFEAAVELDACALDQKRSITLFNEGWHQGVVGLVAARVKERHHRPTIAFARADATTLRGSGRSIDGVHLRDALDLVTKVAPQVIEKFGGHAMAAGLTLKAERYEAFGRAFEAVLQTSCEAALFQRTIATDGQLAPDDFTLGLLESIERQIWGQGFPPPLFANEFAVLEQRLINDAHLRLTLELDGRRLPAIWFRRSAPLPSRALLAYRLDADDYQGLRRIQLVIEHMG